MADDTSADDLPAPHPAERSPSQASPPARMPAAGPTVTPAVLVAGEVIVDLLPASSTGGLSLALEGRFGGSPANVAVGLARLGTSVGYVGRLAAGGYGPWLRSHLDDEGVDLTSSVVAVQPCTLAVVHLDDEGVARYEFYGPETADWAWERSELPEPVSLAGRAVHSGSLATALRPGAPVLVDWLRDLRDTGDIAITYDPNLRPSLLGPLDLHDDVVGPALAAAHLVKVSEEDLGVLHPGEGIGDVARRWVETDPGPDVVIVTGGSAGARAWHRDGRHVHRPAPAVTVIDTVGAGDAFTAGLLASLSAAGLLTPGGLATVDDDSLAAALDLGNRVAARTCTRVGADPPRLSEL